MKFYLYSSQDLILKSDSEIHTIISGEIFSLSLNNGEKVWIYSTTSQGVIVLDENIVQSRQHSQIIFHVLNKQDVLCEIKPFISFDLGISYSLQNSNLKYIEDGKYMYIQFKDNIICHEKIYLSPTFYKFSRNNKEYGLLKWEGENKYIIFINNEELLYNSRYIDYELTDKHLQIYSHEPNVFNVGKLTEYNFQTTNFEYKSIKDRGEEKHLINNEFNLIYFLEAIKCGRFKYAHSKLSYDLRTTINLQILEQYFSPFDKYIFLHEQQAYITTKNDKIVGIYHFVIKDNLIDNIY